MNQAQKLYAATWVEVHTQQSALPARLQLGAVRDHVRQGRLRDDVSVRTAPGEAWRPARDVIAECVELQPTRAWPFLGLIVGLTVLFGALQIIMAGVGAIAGVFFTLVAAVTVISIVLATPSLRTRASMSLLKLAYLSVPAIAGILVPFVWTEYQAIKQLGTRDRIESAFAAADPCAVRRVKEEIESAGEPSLKQRYDARDDQCEEKIRNGHCVKMGPAIDTGTTADIASADGETARLAVRLATHAVTSTDLGTVRAQLDCADEVWPRLTKTFAHDAKAWTPPPSSTDARFPISPDMLNNLGAQHVEAPIAAMLRDRAETAAKVVATKTKLEDIGAASQVCEQVRDLQVETGPACTTLLTRYGALSKRDSVARAAADARNQAQADAVGEEKRKRDGRQFVACMTSCRSSRSQDERAAESACLERCVGDVTCASKCHRASACELSCAQKYPEAVNDALYGVP